MGSGKYLNYAIKKHGARHFTKEILFVFDNPVEMYDKEAEIVNVDFLAEENTYNLKVGGFGGWDHVNTTKPYNPSHTARHAQLMSKVSHLRNPQGQFYNKRHSLEAKNKISIANSGKGIGNENSQYGTRWIHSTELKKSKKITKNTLLPEGWQEGRKMKW
jgi:hypothetical protein